MRFQLAVCAALAVITGRASAFSGDGTAYGPAIASSSGASGYNCGYSYLAAGARKYYAAITATQYDGSAACGRCARVECVSGCGSSATPRTVMFVDKCPECKYGDLDFSNEAYREIIGSDPGRVKIKWEYTSCSSLIDSSGIKIKTKDGSNPFWVAIQVNNAAQAIESITMKTKGVSRKLERMEYNYYSASFNDVGGAGASELTIVSQNSEVITVSIAGINSGELTETGKQFSGAAAAPPATSPSSAPSNSSPSVTPTTKSSTAPTSSSDSVSSEASPSGSSGSSSTDATPTTGAEGETRDNSALQGQVIGDALSDGDATSASAQEMDSTSGTSPVIIAFSIIGCVAFVVGGVVLFRRRRNHSIPGTPSFGSTPSYIYGTNGTPRDSAEIRNTEIDEVSITIAKV